MSMIAPSPLIPNTSEQRRQARLRDALVLITDLLGDLRRLGYTDALAAMVDLIADAGSGIPEDRPINARTMRDFLEQRVMQPQPALPYLARRIAACLLDPMDDDSTVADVRASLAALQHDQPAVPR